MKRLFGASGSKPIALPSAALDRFVPENSIETALKGVVEGRIEMGRFLAALLGGALFVPSATEADASVIGEQFQPIGYDHAEHGPMMIAFTAASRADERVRGFFQTIRSGVLVDATAFLKVVPIGIGLHLNPGWAVSLEMPARGLADFKTDAGLLKLN